MVSAGLLDNVTYCFEKSIAIVNNVNASFFVIVSQKRIWNVSPKNNRDGPSDYSTDVRFLDLVHSKPKQIWTRIMPHRIHHALDLEDLFHIKLSVNDAFGTFIETFRDPSAIWCKHSRPGLFIKAPFDVPWIVIPLSLNTAVAINTKLPASIA